MKYMYYRFLFYTLNFYLIIHGQNTNNNENYYDEDIQNEKIQKKEEYQKIIEEHNKNGYILYSKENIEFIFNEDPEGDKIPFLVILFVSDSCIFCRPLKDGVLIKELSVAVNKELVSYEDINHNNSTGSRAIFLLINLTELEYNQDLRVFLRKIPAVFALPTLGVYCRNKECHKKEKQKKQSEIESKSGIKLIYRCLGNNIKITILQEILNSFLSHGFKKQS